MAAAARMLPAVAAASASASKPGLSREVAISGSFGTCKGFCKLPWITTHGASGLRQSAGRNDVGAFAVGRRASGFSGSGKKPRSGQKFPRKQVCLTVFRRFEFHAESLPVELLFPRNGALSSHLNE